MSQDPPRRRDHLPPKWHADVAARKKAQLEFFLEHGEWMSEQVMYDELEAGDRAGLHEDGIEVSREHALARGCSPELVELMYGPSIHKKKDTGEKKE
jgi:hypothetical protein